MITKRMPEKSKKQATSKYLAKKEVYDGIKFDSKLEARYYRYLQDQVESGLVERFELQPKFLLLDKFTHEVTGEKVRKIEYIADFKVWYTGEKTPVIIDVKGMPPTADFKIKAKLFKKNNPELELRLYRYLKKFGGWITIEEEKVFRREEKKNKKKA